jgi:hypothetical protein
MYNLSCFHVSKLQNFMKIIFLAQLMNVVEQIKYSIMKIIYLVALIGVLSLQVARSLMIFI